MAIIPIYTVDTTVIKLC